MTREELIAVIEVVLGLQNTPGRVSTILAAADAYATDQVVKAITPDPYRTLGEPPAERYAADEVAEDARARWKATIYPHGERPASL